MSYLVVSSIQMGANIDYAIVIATRYQELKDKTDHRQAIIETLNFAFPTVLTSGSIMTVAGILTDTSGVDIELVRLGKVCASTNNGSVSGDINVGGAAGAIAIEYEYDPEDDVSSNISSEYKKEYELKAVLQNCTNKGAVTARQ